MKKVNTRILKLPRFGAEVLSSRRSFAAGPLVCLTAATLGILVGLAVLAGYAIGYEPAWRLRPGLPAIHPFTALCIVLLGLGLLPRSLGAGPWWRMAARGVVILSILLLLIRVTVPVFGPRLFDELTPFGTSVMAQRDAGKTLTMGVASSYALLLLAVGEALRWFRRPVLSQTLAACSVALLFMAATAYLAGLRPFHGTMAPATLLGTALLAVALLFATPRHGFMRALTAASAPGRLARVVLGSSTALLMVIGWVVAFRIDAPGIPLPADGELLVYQTALMLALTWAIVTVITVRADRLDRYRGLTERLIERTATRDALTGVMTRNQLMRAGASAGNDGPKRTAALLIDIDRFRTVNEGFGPKAGDRILVEVARRLRDVAGSHAMGRLGGDEFAIHCTGVSLEQAERLAARAVQSIAAPFDIKGRKFRLTASVGVAHAESSGSADLQQAADEAMLVAKDRGGNRHALFALDAQESRKQQVELEQDLHEALRRDDELSLHFQPVVGVKDHQILAVEALARWHHPRLGPIPPDRFIKIAETSGLMGALGKKLMQMAVRQAAAWEANRPGSCPLMNINVSPAQFGDGDVIGELRDAVRRHGLAPERFCIEITEGVFADEPAVRALQEARALGFRVAMDDFGLGYSTLSQLPRLPLTSVKLDRSFIVSATESAGDAAIVDAITKMAHALKLFVVAEGVETKAQLDLVVACGCDAVQGFLLARPMRPEALNSWLERGYIERTTAEELRAP